MCRRCWSASNYPKQGPKAIGGCTRRAVAFVRKDAAQSDLARRHQGSYL
jgi:hypothetical protein